MDPVKRNNVLIPLVVAALLLVLAITNRHVFFPTSGEPPAMVAATPNPAPSGQTTVTWRTGAHTVGQVWVSINGEPERLFAQAVSGTQEVTWITGRCVFTLYTGTDHATPLASVVVTR